MATRIAFSTHYPDRMGELAGKPTYFHYKIASGLGIKSLFGSCNPMYLHPKTTTIRKNYDYWKAKEGQLIQPFFWAGKPYRSKHVVFCPEVRLAKVRKVKVKHLSIEGERELMPIIWLDGYCIYDGYHMLDTVSHVDFENFTKDEGFDHPDHFWMWFDQDFSGAYLELESVGS